MADSTINRLWSLIRQLQAALDGQAIRGGTEGATWPGGGATSDNVTIPHGLGATPASVQFTSYNSKLKYQIISKDATNIVAQGYFTDGTALSGTFSFDWLALG